MRSFSNLEEIKASGKFPVVRQAGEGVAGQAFLQRYVSQRLEHAEHAQVRAMDLALKKNWRILPGVAGRKENVERAGEPPATKGVCAEILHASFCFSEGRRI